MTTGKRNTLKDEALNNDISFEYSGETFTVPPAKEWPLDAIEAQERSQMLSFIRELLGDDQYKTLRKVAKTLGDINDFSEKMYEALDVDQGK